MDKVSVVVPVYNVDTYLAECIDSILSQTYENIELLIVDDGSNDTSLQIAKRYQHENDDLVKVFHQNNRGVSSARNLGIEKSTGEYITFVDGDDLIASNMIQELMKIMKDTSSTIVTSRNSSFYDQRTFRHYVGEGNSPEVTTVDGVSAAINMLYQKDILNSPHGKIFKKTIFKKELRFPINVPIGEDLYLNYKVFLDEDKISITRSEFYGYRVRLGSAMRSSFNPMRIAIFDLFQDMLSDAVSRRRDDLALSVSNRIFAEAIFIGIQAVYLRNQRNVRIVCCEYIRKLRKSVLFDPSSLVEYRFYAAISYASPILMICLVRMRVALGGYLRRVFKK